MVVVIAAYLAAHVAFEWLGRRFLIVSGAEYLLLGLLLGPQVSGVIDPDMVGGFAPFMTLALGWIGAVVGAQFVLPALMAIPGHLFQVAFLQALATVALAAGIMGGILLWILPGAAPVELVLPAVALGAIATASAPAGVALVSRRLGHRTAVIRQLEVATAVDAAVAILVFGLLLSVFHAAPPVSIRPPTATEWAVISLAIGVVGGALFHLFLGDERKVDRLFIALAGAIILVSGAAAYLRLSPLLPAMLVGAILANTHRDRPELAQVLGRVERPLYFVLLIFAGAAWRPAEAGWLLPVLLFVAVRPLVKVAGAWLASAASGDLRETGGGWGRGLIGHGGLAVAIALNYRLHDGALYPDVVFTATLLSVLVTDVVSPRFVGSAVEGGRPGRGASPPPRRREPEAG